jgi:hypothetical protein
VGWLAAVGAFLALRAALKRPVRGTSLDWRSLGPTALAWLALVFLAPFSSIPHWHYWRHHHGGLALAWILAMACAADLVERWRRERAVRWRLVSLVAPLVLFLGLPGWGLRYAEGMDVLWQRNGRGATWIRALEGGPVLLVDDAGLLALYHDGPLIDAVGLGSHGLALPFRHGPGSLLEALARRSPAPEIAAVHQGLFRIPELLGERLRDPAVPGDVVIARVRRDRLASTLLAGPGVDFGLLKDETALSWDPPPHANQASFALLRPTATGQEVLGGCRPLRGTLQAALPFDGPVTLRVTALDEQPTSIRIRVRGAPGSKLVERTVPLAATEWTDAALEAASPGPSTLELQRRGPGVPCLESLF